jgi:hypothetical protein
VTALLHPITPRRLSPILDAMAAEEPVIALHGPRSVGKSTLLATFAAARAVPVLDLEDDAVRDAILANPSLAIGEHTPVCLDEYQRAPGVLDAIKARLNREGTLPGTAVLTGSTRHDALPRTAQALTGRGGVVWFNPPYTPTAMLANFLGRAVARRCGPPARSSSTSSRKAFTAEDMPVTVRCTPARRQEPGHRSKGQQRDDPRRSRPGAAPWITRTRSRHHPPPDNTHTCAGTGVIRRAVNPFRRLDLTWNGN